MQKNNKLVEILKGAGLSDNESLVYFTLLSLGSSSVLNISRASGIKRTTVYSTLESLKQKGLVSIEMRGLKSFFVAENPEKLESVLEERKNKFKSALGEFSSLYNLKGGESFIKYYEGIEAVKNIYENLLKDIRPHEDYLVVGDQSHWMNLDPDYFQKFIEKRAKLNINIRLLFTDSDIARKHKKFEKNYNEKIKILPKNTKLKTNLVITPQRVVVHQLTEPIMAIVIENKSIIQMHKELFEIIWNTQS